MLRSNHFFLFLFVLVTMTAQEVVGHQNEIYFSSQPHETEWEYRLQTYFKNTHTPYFTRLRFYTYLYSAQNDAVTYPLEIQDYITQKLIQRFFPGFTHFLSFSCDSYYLNLAEDLLCPYFVRLSLEDASLATFASNCWRREIPASTTQIAKWIAWTPPSPRPPPPLEPSNQKGWIEQFAELKKIRHDLTAEQRNLLKKWVGKHGKEYEWRVMTNQLLQEKNIPYAKQLLVKATIMRGLYDGLIAEMKAKYTFCVPRPFMMDPSFSPLIRPLDSPSYPSGHAIQGSIWSALLSYFFPEESDYCEELDVEGAQSRLWAGVHFPIDIEQGRILGKEIAAQIISRISQQSHTIVTE